MSKKKKQYRTPKPILPLQPQQHGNGRVVRAPTQGEVKRANWYLKRFVDLFNNEDPGTTKAELSRILNVEISSLLSQWPDEKHLIRVAMGRFKEMMAEMRKAGG